VLSIHTRLRPPHGSGEVVMASIERRLHKRAGHAGESIAIIFVVIDERRSRHDLAIARGKAEAGKVVAFDRRSKPCRPRRLERDGIFGVAPCALDGPGGYDVRRDARRAAREFRCPCGYVVRAHSPMHSRM
jgi:hypothetical protein